MTIPASPYRFIFDGQSLNAFGDYPGKLMAQHAPLIPYNVPAVGGAPWSTLAARSSQVLPRFFDKAETIVYIMCGGTTEIGGGESSSTYVAVEQTQSALAKSLGADIVVNTTLVASDTMGAPAIAQLNAANATKKASPQVPNDWSACSDFYGDGRLADPNNATYYLDGVHWTDAGGQVAADLMFATLHGLGIL